MRACAFALDQFAQRRDEVVGINPRRIDHAVYFRAIAKCIEQRGIAGIVHRPSIEAPFSDQFRFDQHDFSVTRVVHDTAEYARHDLWGAFKDLHKIVAIEYEAAGDPGGLVVSNRSGEDALQIGDQRVTARFHGVSTAINDAI